MEQFEVRFCEGAEAMLGVADRKQPDWFRENEAVIKPML